MSIQYELSDEEAGVAVGLFAMLLKGFELSKAEPRPSVISRLSDLLDGFVSLKQTPLATLTDLDRNVLLEGHAGSIEHDRLRQEDRADDFNLLDVLQATYKETRHSMVLAWLLDRELRKHGTHAQGNLGFRLFLEDLNLPKSFADERYWVRREVAGDEARVDIEVASRGRFLFHIENKIRSSEGSRQTDREWDDLQRRAAALGVTEADKVYALFLTPTGSAAKNINFRPISWRQIAQTLERFSEMAKPADVKLFAAHYSRALWEFVVRDEMKGD